MHFRDYSVISYINLTSQLTLGEQMDSAEKSALLKFAAGVVVILLLSFFSSGALWLLPIWIVFWIYILMFALVKELSEKVLDKLGFEGHGIIKTVLQLGMVLFAYAVLSIVLILFFFIIGPSIGI
jgi:hypothetical protein